jgi:hypothetical protein
MLKTHFAQIGQIKFTILFLIEHFPVSGSHEGTKPRSLAGR